MIFKYLPLLHQHLKFWNRQHNPWMGHVSTETAWCFYDVPSLQSDWLPLNWYKQNIVYVQTKDETLLLVSFYEIQSNFSSTVNYINNNYSLPHYDSTLHSGTQIERNQTQIKGVAYHAKELPSSTMSSSQKTHQTRFWDSSCGRRKLGFLRKNLTSAILDRNRLRKAERSSLWRGKYLCRGPWSWWNRHTLQNSNSLFFFAFVFFSSIEFFV